MGVSVKRVGMRQFCGSLDPDGQASLPWINPKPSFEKLGLGINGFGVHSSDSSHRGRIHNLEFGVWSLGFWVWGLRVGI